MHLTCTNHGNHLVWRSAISDTDLIVAAGVKPPLPSSTFSGVMFKEMNNNNGTCINFTLTFTGNLKGLNKKTLNCTTGLEDRKTLYTIIIPSKQTNHLVWQTSIFDTDYIVATGADPPAPSSTIGGIMFQERHNNDENCLNSTLTFTGNLKALNGTRLECTTLTIPRKTSIAIIIPSK